MAIGYTRQSSADIIPSENVRAGPLNAEFDKLEASMDASTGHNHDGTEGGGAKIHLVNSVDTTTKLRLQEGGSNADLSTATTDSYIVKGASALTYRRNNFTAVAAPTVGDDSADGYGTGSLWYDTVASVLYICVISTVGAASWVSVVNTGTASFPPTSNLGMGGYIFTNMGDGSSSGQSIHYGQVQTLVSANATPIIQLQPGNYAVAAGTDTYTATLSPALTTYGTGGLALTIKFTNANTSTATLNVNGLGAVAIKKTNGNALSAGDIAAGGVYLVRYDGTDFYIIGVAMSTQDVNNILAVQVFS